MNSDFHDQPHADLDPVDAELRRRRPSLDPIALDRVKLRAMSRGRRTTRPAGGGLFAMRSRLTTLLAVVFIAAGTGGALAGVGGGATPFNNWGGSASHGQYRPPCDDFWSWDGHHCNPDGHHRHWHWLWGWGWFWSGHDFQWRQDWCWTFS